MGVELEFLSSKALAGKTSDEKIELIIDAVKRKKIIVLEEGLTRQEERDLFSRTMKEIGKTKGFTGIEISSLGESVEDFRGAIIKALGGKAMGLTVVGPSKLVKQLKQEPEALSFVTGK